MDKPYEERLGGSYVVDPKTGKPVRQEGTEQPGPEAAPAAEPEGQAVTEPARKGK